MTNTLKLAHGCSLSNLALFVAAGAGFMADEGLDVYQPDYVADMESPAGLLATGEADMGTTAFTQPFIDAFRPNPVRILCGSGLRGIELLGQPQITSAVQLEGLKVATFRGDPMEVLAHDALAAAGLAMSDVEVVYVRTWAEAFSNFLNGEWDALTAIEPHASRLRAAGANSISDGTELWGREFPDTVLVATSGLLEHRPEAARAAIRAMLKAERFIETDPEAAIGHSERFFPDYTLAELLVASNRQPPRVDLTGLESTIVGRWPSLRSLGLVSKEHREIPDVFELTLLREELETTRAGMKNVAEQGEADLTGRAQGGG